VLRMHIVLYFIPNPSGCSSTVDTILHLHLIKWSLRGELFRMNVVGHACQRFQQEWITVSTSENFFTVNIILIAYIEVPLYVLSYYS
jgi:thiazole synthase ThiGH ThiG subunit